VIDLSVDVVDLTAALVAISSESHAEGEIASSVEQALGGYEHLEVIRLNNTVVARTNLGRTRRVLVGGHLDTVPEADNGRPTFVRAGEPVPVIGPDGLTTAPEDRLYGLGASDMKGGVAVALLCAVGVGNPVHDVTYVFYECEEVDGRFSGLKLIADTRPELLEADFAVLMEPSEAGIEAGCQGTLRADVTTKGVRAHSARGWLGDNAIHNANEILARLNAFVPEQPVIDGLTYREGLNAVSIRGGVAGNVIPDECVVTVNFRYAPNRTGEQAVAFVCDFFSGFEVTVTDNASGALPGLDLPEAIEFVAVAGSEPRPKFGWTDVARMAARGVPALNFGPGSPSVAHARHEFVPLDDLRRCHTVMHNWLAGE